TGKDAAGVDGIVDDRVITPRSTVGGNEVAVVWSSPVLPPRLADEEDADHPAWTLATIPEAAGARWSMARIPPMSSVEARESTTRVGMHVTDTLDYILIVQGSL